MRDPAVHVGTLEAGDKTVHLYYRHLSDGPYPINYENLRSVLDWWKTGVGPNGETMEPAKLENLYNYLKQHATKIDFENGSIRVRLRKDESYRFYSPELSSISSEDVHSHRGRFEATVMKGKLVQSFYDVEQRPAASHEIAYVLRFVSTNPERPAPTATASACLRLLATTEHVPGTTHTIEFTSFHKILPSNQNTIVYIKSGPKITDSWSVASKAAGQQDSQAKSLTEDGCWAHVKKIIEEP